MTHKIQTRVIITGHVQGVFYRAKTKIAADALNIKGYVKNRSNGSVEAVIQGDEQEVARMIEWCRQGPPASKVEHVRFEKMGTISDFNSFEIKY